MRAEGSRAARAGQCGGCADLSAMWHLNQELRHKGTGFPTAPGAWVPSRLPSRRLSIPQPPSVALPSPPVGDGVVTPILQVRAQRSLERHPGSYHLGLLVPGVLEGTRQRGHPSGTAPASTTPSQAGQTLPVPAWDPRAPTSPGGQVCCPAQRRGRAVWEGPGFV